jgi:type I restriction enzyme M protein
MIGDEDWSGMDVDIKGAIYEGLLEKTASSSDKGAGQYFTPRPLIRAIVEVMQPRPGQVIGDPACGTGGFLLAAHDYISEHHQLDKAQRKHLKTEALWGTDIVDGVVRLCAMNMYLHGIGKVAEASSLSSSGKDQRRDASATMATIDRADALAQPSGRKFDMILANPPFGKKGGYTIVGDDGKISTEKQEYERDEFWATTANKQLNFLQHIVSELKVGGTAAVVLPDNVLFEGGAGETIRRELLKRCNVHTLLRLPTGIFYAQGVKANVLFFERKAASETPWTKDLWIYDLRTNQHFTLKTNPLANKDLDDFKAVYHPGAVAKRQVTERFKKFTYEEIVARDKANLDIFWLKDESLEDSENLPAPAVLAAEIVESLEAALAEFRAVEEALAPVEEP